MRQLISVFSCLVLFSYVDDCAAAGEHTCLWTTGARLLPACGFYPNGSSYGGTSPSGKASAWTSAARRCGSHSPRKGGRSYLDCPGEEGTEALLAWCLGTGRPNHDDSYRVGGGAFDGRLREAESRESGQTGSEKQTEYVEGFRGAVLAFLDFAPMYTALSEQFADAVTQHATPVGSGTVARTRRIPIEKRAESAVIAWLRHATTAYDNLKIPRIKGKRREVRRMLAEQSRRLLEDYRTGHETDLACPLRQALSSTGDSTL